MADSENTRTTSALHARVNVSALCRDPRLKALFAGLDDQDFTGADIDLPKSPSQPGTVRLLEPV